MKKNKTKKIVFDLLHYVVVYMVFLVSFLWFMDMWHDNILVIGLMTFIGFVITDQLIHKLFESGVGG